MLRLPVPWDRDKRPALIYVRKSHTLFMALDTGRRNPDALDPGHLSTGPRAESLGGVERFDPLSETCDRPPSIGGRSSGKETRVHVCVNPKQFLLRLKALAPLCGPPLPKPDPRNRADAGHGGPAGSAPRFVLSFPRRRVPPSLPERGFRFLLMPIEQPGEIRDGRSAPQPADRPETVTQQEPNQEMPRKDEALSA